MKKETRPTFLMFNDMAMIVTQVIHFFKQIEKLDVMEHNEVNQEVEMKKIFLFLLVMSLICSGAEKEKTDRGERPDRPGMKDNVLDRLPELSKELGLTSDQEVKLTPIILKFGEDLKKIMMEAKDSKETRKEAMEQSKQLKEKFISDVSAVLTPEQAEKLKGMLADGGRNNPETMIKHSMQQMKKELSLTPEQEPKIEEIVKKKVTVVTELMKKAAETENNIFEKSRIMQQIKETDEKYDLEIMKLLDENQKKKFEEIQKKNRDRMKDRIKDRQMGKGDEQNE